jgi:hypothetical protein
VLINFIIVFVATGKFIAAFLPCAMFPKPEQDHDQSLSYNPSHRATSQFDAHEESLYCLRRSPITAPDTFLSPCTGPQSFLCGWRTFWCRIDGGPSASVSVLRRLHLMIRLSSTEVSLVFSIVASRVLLVVCRRWLVGLLRLLVVRVVLRSSVTERCSANPSCAVQRLSANATSSARAEEATFQSQYHSHLPMPPDSPEEEEDEECAQDDYAECNPSAPIVPCTVAPIGATITIVASSHVEKRMLIGMISRVGVVR